MNSALSIFVNGAFNFVNGASIFVNGAFIFVNGAFSFVNGAFIFLNGAFIFVTGASLFYKWCCYKANFKMADCGHCVEGLRNLVLGEIESISRILVGPSQMSAVQETLEKIDQIVEAINCLDSVTRIHYRDPSIARGIIQRSSATSARTLRVNTGIPRRPSYEISKDQLQSLIDLRFTVPQISELLHVSKRTIERRLAEYGISARSFTTITDQELDSQVRDIKIFLWIKESGWLP